MLVPRLWRLRAFWVFVFVAALTGAPVQALDWHDSNFVAVVHIPAQGQEVHRSASQLFWGYSYWEAEGQAPDKAEYWGDHRVEHTATQVLYHLGQKVGRIVFPPQHCTLSAEWTHYDTDATLGWPLGGYTSEHRTGGQGAKRAKDTNAWQLVQ